MKRLWKLCLSILGLLVWFVGAYSHASQMTVILRPGWNVFSTPALLSNISFSNWWDGVSFLKLENGQWVSVIANTWELIPLEWFLVENTNNSDVEVTLIYDDNVPPTNTIFQKNLNLWWNFLGITTNVNPFNNIVWNVNMTIDFTYSSDGSSQTNFLNKVNSNYVGNQNSSTILAPQYWEAYWAFITSNNAIYWWINNKGAENGVVDPNAIWCTAEELFACILDDNTSECLDNCRNRWVDLTISNKVTADVITAPWVNDLVLMDLELTAGTEFDIQKYELKANSDLNFDQFVGWKVTLMIDGVEYDITEHITNFSLQGDYFSVEPNHKIRIKVIWDIKNENAFIWDFTPTTFEFRIKQVKNIEVDKEILWLSIRESWHITNIIPQGKAIISTATLAASVSESLFANKEQEIMRFAIEAEWDDVMVKSLELRVSTDGNKALLTEVKNLMDWELKLVNVETEEEIAATFENMTADWKIFLRDMNYNIKKNGIINLKLMVDLWNIDEVIDWTTSISILSWTIKSKISQINTGILLWVLTTKTYTFRPTAPIITLSKVSDNMFKINIRNADENNAIIYNDLVYRLRTDINNADFSWKVCLVDDVNTLVCPSDTNTQNFWRTTTHHWYSDETLAKNSEHDYYILIDSNYIGPSIIRMEISSLSYGITTPIIERYNIMCIE